MRGAKKKEKIYNNEGVSEAADENPLYLMFSRGVEEIWFKRELYT